MINKGILLFISVVFSVSNCWTQQFQLEDVTKGQVFIGSWPQGVQYSALGDSIFYYRQDELDTMKHWFALVGDNEVAIKNNVHHRFGNRIEHPMSSNIFLWKTSNTIYHGDLKKKELKHLLTLPNTISDVRWSGTGDSFFLTVGKNILMYEEGSLKTLAQWKPEAQNMSSESDEWLKDQQKMFDILVLQETQEKMAEETENSKKAFETISYKKGLELHNFKVSNDQNIFWAIATEREDKATEYMDYVTRSGHSKAKKARTKVGQVKVNQDLYWFDMEKDSLQKFDKTILPGIFEKPEFLTKETDDTLKEPKSLYVHGPILNVFNEWAIVSFKSDDNKDRWIVAIHPEKGVKIVDHQHDDAWIGGPGITGWNMVQGNIGWKDNGKSIWYQSEKTGYSHLYQYNIDSEETEQLTKGDFEVHDVIYHGAENMIYYTANRINPGVRNLYKINSKNNTTIPILEGYGKYEVEFAPDYKTISGLYSTRTWPFEVFVAKNEGEAQHRLKTQSTTEAFNRLDIYEPEIISFKASDEKSVPARVYKPENSNGAGIIFVHGAGYLQNAHYWWSSYFREFMFHQLLREKGYTIIDIDYRASEGYGRDWRTAIYRHMGGNDLSDQVDGRQFLIDSLGIDETRIGIYGGSYGGFITLMALLTEPGKFKCGAALRSVTDWAHYNHPYTSNILNTPVEDSLAFYRSSPINFAENLEDRLLMLHGVLDDNVQYQDILRLSQRFIELRKENWELASYPLEPHGFRYPTSWYDEYRRIFEMFEEELR